MLIRLEEERHAWLDKLINQVNDITVAEIIYFFLL